MSGSGLPAVPSSDDAEPAVGAPVCDDTDGSEVAPQDPEDDPEDAQADPDDEDEDDDLDDGPDDPLAYLAPSRAAKALGMPLYELRRLVDAGHGPPVARFMTGRRGTGRSGWKIRRDVLQQWFDWQRFLDEWVRRERQAA